MFKDQITTILAILISLNFNCSANANPYQDSLENVLSTKNLSFEDEFDVLTDLGFSYYGYDSEQLFKYANLALELATDHQDSYSIGLANMLIAIGHLQTSELYLSSVHFEKSLEIFRELDKPRDIINVCSNLSVVNQELGDYEQGIFYLLEALKHAESQDDTRSQLVILNNLAMAYKNFEDYDRAMERLREAEDIALESGDSAVLKSVYINIIAINIIGEKYKDALSMVDKIYPYILRKGDLKSEISVLLHAGTIYKELGQYEKALANAEKALELAEKINDKGDISSALNDLGLVHTHLGHHDTGENFLLRSLALLEESELSGDKLGALESLVEHYKLRGDYKSAFEYNERRQALSDSLLNQEKEVRIAALESQYENQKKEQTIASLQKDQQIGQLRQRFLIVGLIAVLLLGGFIGYIQYARTRRKNQQIKNEQILNRQLQESHDMKIRFFTNISHELRTPLTLIQAPLEQAKDENRYSLNKDEILLMHRNSKRLQQLINQILEISRIESGLVMLNLTKTPVLKFIRQTCEVFEDSANLKNIQFNINIPDDSVHAHVDEDKLIKIITNLLSNAIKYNRQNGQVMVSARTEDRDYVIIEVSDTGIGMSPEELDHIFDRFYMAKPDANENSTGIGLSLVKELVGLCEGTIDVKSEKNKGTQFTVKLPVNPDILQSAEFQISDLSDSDELIHEEDINDEEESALQNQPSILIVEDNQEIRQYLKKNLGKNFQLFEAQNGKEGVDMALEKIPDLIITDVMMPVMDGVEVVKKLKNDPATDHIPIIMLTAKGETDAKLTGYETGADDYIPKPFNLKELTIRINNLIRQRDLLKEKFSKLIKVGVENIDAKSKDEVFLARALEVVEQHYKETEFSADQFTKEIAMSRMQLHRKLKALTGFSTSEFIRSIRLKKAHQLIEKDSGNINEIAYEVGFTDPSYFTKCFRRYFGYSPSQLSIRNKVVLN